MESISKVLATSFGGYSLEHILSAVITLLVCLLAVRLIMRAVEKLMGRIKQPNERLSRITVNFIKALLYLLTVIITAGATVCSAAMLAAQSAFSCSSARSWPACSGSPPRPPRVHCCSGCAAPRATASTP